MARFNFGGPPGRGFTFDLGADPAVGDLLFNNQSWESMFPQAWQQVVTKLGGNASSDYAQWLRGWQAQAKAAYGQVALNTGTLKGSPAPDPTVDPEGYRRWIYANDGSKAGDLYKLKVTDFLNTYAKGIGDIYQNQSAAARGVDTRFAGRPRMLG